MESEWNKKAMLDLVNRNAKFMLWTHFVGSESLASIPFPAAIAIKSIINSDFLIF